MKIFLIILAGAILVAPAAFAAEPAKSTSNICELTCDYRQVSGPKRIVTCYERMDERQCAATADHKNLNDAYPSKMSCAAKLVAACAELRQF